MDLLKQWSPSYIWHHDIAGAWHSFLVNASTNLDAVAGILIVVLLFLRLFQLKIAGKAVLPMLGVYLLLKVMLP